MKLGFNFHKERNFHKVRSPCDCSPFLHITEGRHRYVEYETSIYFSGKLQLDRSRRSEMNIGNDHACQVHGIITQF